MPSYLYISTHTWCQIERKLLNIKLWLGLEKTMVVKVTSELKLVSRPTVVLETAPKHPQDLLRLCSHGPLAYRLFT